MVDVGGGFLWKTSGGGGGGGQVTFISIGSCHFYIQINNFLTYCFDTLNEIILPN